MATPRIADRTPMEVQFQKSEELHWCACGRSNSQPFCDGSHVGTEFTPVAFEAKAGETAHLCMCKHTKNPPYCDGTHATLSESEEDQSPPAESADGMPIARPTPEEPTVKAIHDLARDGLSKTGHHGAMGAMGVPGNQLPAWDDIQFLTAQLARKPLLDEASVGTELIIGPGAKKPLELDIPLFVSDMSFGALSEEAKTALARGAEMSGTGICSGEGGMLPEEQEANSRYFYELASAKFGFEEELLTRVQAFHFKGGRERRPGRVATCPETKSSAKSRKCEVWKKDRMRSLLQHSPT
jgi:CDGSH-type Zn-finger protein